MRRVPDFTQTTSLVSRALRMSPAQLQASFRPAQEHDLQRVVALRRAEFKDIGWDDLAYLRWRYRFGNAGRGDCWLLERDEDVLGIIGTEEVSLNGACGPCCAVFLMDILVRKDVRGIAIGPWMNMALIAQYECVAVMGSNDNSNSMVTGLFADKCSLRSYTFYLKCERTLRRHFNVPLATSFMAGIGDLALRGWRFRHAHRVQPTQIKCIAALDELEPYLSQWRHTDGDSGRVRSGEFLDWRVVRNPRDRYRITATWRSGRPAAYLIVKEVATPHSGRELRLVDWLGAPDDDGTALRSLIVSAIDWGAANACNIVTTSLLHRQSEAMLRDLGFILRPKDTVPFVHTCRAPHPLRNHSTGWYLTPLDGDVD